MIKFLHSFFYFFTLIFRRKHFDVVFYTPTYFNRGENGENPFFINLIQSCKNNNLSYIIFEEPSKFNHIRNKKSIPFDFIFYLIILLRRWMKVENDIIQTENNIGDFLSKSFFRNFRYNNYIVISKSMISVFSRIDKDAKLYDLQHGIIYTNKPDYFSNNILSPHLRRNKVSLLLSGRLFKDILLKNGDKNFIEKNAHVIGVEKINKILHQEANRDVLVSLQFTDDHTDNQNKKLLLELTSYINNNKEFNFFLRDHPRFNQEVILDHLYQQEHVFIAPESLYDCFKKCSIHLTSYSTTTFECALYGIPTVFLDSLEDDFNMFTSDYYVRKNSISFIFNHYKQESLFVRNWVEGYYSPFEEKKFISLLQ